MEVVTISVRGMDRMRLVVVSEFAYSEVSPTAAGTQIRAIRDLFTKRGWRVTVAVPSTDGGQGPADEVDIKRLVTYETLRQRLGSPIAAIFFPLSLAQYLECFRAARPNLIIVSAYSPFLLFEPLLVARLLGIPVVYDVLDSWIVLSAVHPGRLRNWLRRAAERLALSRGDLVIGVTKRGIRLLEQVYHISPSKLMMVPRGLDSRVKARQSTPVYDVIHAGPPRDYYDNQGALDFLAGLAAQRSGFRAAYLGIPDGAIKQNLQAQLERRGIAKCVDLLPPVPRSEVIEWTSRSRAGLVALTKKQVYASTVSTKSYDYIAAGIPILYLGPKESEQAEIIMHFGIGRVAETPPGLVEEARRILSDDVALRQLRERSRVAADTLSWDKVLDPLYRRTMELALPGGERRET